jgi:hypothetical protein
LPPLRKTTEEEVGWAKVGLGWEGREREMGQKRPRARKLPFFLYSLFLFSVFPNFCTILKVELVLENYRNISDLPIKY